MKIPPITFSIIRRVTRLITQDNFYEIMLVHPLKKRDPRLLELFTWLTLMSPQQEIAGLVHLLMYNFVFATCEKQGIVFPTLEVEMSNSLARELRNASPETLTRILKQMEKDHLELSACLKRFALRTPSFSDTGAVIARTYTVLERLLESL